MHVSAVERRELECRDCGAVLGVDPSLRTTTCGYCRSPSVIERPPSRERPTPLFVLPFVTPREMAAEAVQSWQRRIGFFRSSVLKKAPVSEVWGVYLPALLYSAVAHSGWSAMVGENYTVGSGKNQRTETDWFRISGHHSAYVRDVLVSASRVITNHELAGVEPFDLRALHRYTGALVAGWPAEEPGRIRDEAWAEARSEALASVSSMLAGFMPGDTHKELLHRTALSWETAELVLVPVWVLVFRYDALKPPVRLLVNGQTGYFSARAPLSWYRITLVIGLGLLLFILILLGVSALFALLVMAGA